MRLTNIVLKTSRRKFVVSLSDGKVVSSFHVAGVHCCNMLETTQFPNKKNGEIGESKMGGMLY